ncbi:MAG: hypothetical protein COU81_02080 [Candidatus Portnoybacteria bacterium CG10_big_fil_rev_8_21_14_0_10_36_7]|uniref:EamA domain-containing protein n=1 Tax=Candidatus Portnoybacteria bacterium CG10_big_fil_rev_8_21_14_0_10_36_7 TaxID=1974812 RepID=A0A2M8KE30_9BACT|nr:MAG: hypothetical protein COU81_02080 [Candidatus Portnoybacteria bacterium CG10_big_fil_rev_8_21_14_0_10_36_7]
MIFYFFQQLAVGLFWLNLCFYWRAESSLYSLIPIATGIALVYPYGFYGEALRQVDTSSFVILSNIIPVITLILVFIFLG